MGFLIVLGFVVFRLASSQIPSQQGKLSTQLKKEETLRQKSEILRNLDSNIANQVDITSFALPAQNSAFAVSAQLKRLAAENSVIVTNLRIGAEAKEGVISSTDIGFDAEGAMPSVLAFLEGIGKAAPITLIDKIQINQAGGSARATVKTKVFWSELPKTLPAISEPLSDLTNEEKEILVKIVGLTPPDFVLLEPEAPRENVNPF